MNEKEKTLFNLLEESMKNNLKHAILQEPVILGTVDIKSLQPHLAEFILFFQYKNNLDSKHLVEESGISSSTLKFMTNKKFDGDGRIRKTSLNKLIEFIELYQSYHQENSDKQIPDKFTFNDFNLNTLI